jgi:hypothetical protein
VFFHQQKTAVLLDHGSHGDAGFESFGHGGLCAPRATVILKTEKFPQWERQKTPVS